MSAPDADRGYDAETLLPGWRALIVANSDRGIVTIRNAIYDAVEALGFNTKMWDREYDVDAALSTDEASMAEVERADVVIGVIGTGVGTPMRLASRFMSSARLAQLRRLKVVGPDGAPAPTVLEAEIILASALNTPLIALADRTVLGSLRHAVDALTAQSATLMATEAREDRDSSDVGPLNADVLIAEDRWAELGWYFSSSETYAGLSLSQICFLRRMQRAEPHVWLAGLDLARPELAVKSVRHRLAQIPRSIVQTDAWRGSDGPIAELLRSTRNPIGLASINTLIESAQIVDPPFEVDEDTPAADLFAWLREELAHRRSVLIVGDPGVGKSTVFLKGVSDAARDAQAATLVGRWRELTLSDEDPIGSIFGAMLDRRPWPLPMPDIPWRIALDALDESRATLAQITPAVRGLRSRGSIVMTCRTFDYETTYHMLNAYFDRIVRLTPWRDAEIQAYIEAMPSEAAEPVRVYLTTHSGEELEFMSYPLWLSMLAFLMRDSRVGEDGLVGLQGDVEILRACAHAVVTRECERNGLDGDSWEWLARAWSHAAWDLHRAKAPLALNALLHNVHATSSAEQSAVSSILSLFGADHVSGFFHEVFLEFWLAAYITDVIVHLEDGVASSGDPDSICAIFSLHRSRLVNRLIRGRLASESLRPTAVSALRSAYERLDVGAIYARNQLIYLLGRLSDEADAREFLAQLWRTEDSDFVRYSVGFAATIAGDLTIEREFYEALRASESFTNLCLGYHRVYYGDLPDYDERKLPYYDDGIGPAGRAQRALIRRLRKRGSHYAFLRRIEAYTLRKLIETHGADRDTALAVRDLAMTLLHDSPDVRRELRAPLEDELRVLLETVGGQLTLPGFEEAS
jgi:hypothetical protein